MNNTFDFDINKITNDYKFHVYQAASLNNPKNNSVLFIMDKYISKASILEDVCECLIFWPRQIDVPAGIKENNLVIKTDMPRLEFCRFFQDHHIQNLPKDSGDILNGAFISKSAEIDATAIIQPFAYIGDHVSIGKHCYIGTGAKILADTKIKDNVIIRENTVIGSDGLTTDRDENGEVISMPQFGYVEIHDDVTIGANTVIARGAIDQTVIESGCKIDNNVFISHNVHLGKNTIVVGNTILFGSVSTEENVFISGGVSIRNQISIGKNSLIGMGAVVTKHVPEDSKVIGNPAKDVKNKERGNNNG